MSDQLFFSAILAIVALMVVVLAVLLGFLIGSRNTVRSERSSKVRHAKKSSPRKRKSALKRFFLFLKRHWLKRKKRQEVPQVAQPAPVPAALAPDTTPPASAPQAQLADQSKEEKKGKSSLGIVAAVVGAMFSLNAFFSFAATAVLVAIAYRSSGIWGLAMAAAFGAVALFFGIVLLRLVKYLIGK